ncbi:MAG: hypothetical protein PHX54_02615 [Lentimicrobiaceae bacterium]|nr:hypothetical protein [Lentimicrobiaceae bacterium]
MHSEQALQAKQEITSNDAEWNPKYNEANSLPNKVSVPLPGVIQKSGEKCDLDQNPAFIKQ